MDKQLYSEVFGYATQSVLDLVTEYEFTKKTLGKEEADVLEIYDAMEQFTDENPHLEMGVTLGTDKEGIAKLGYMSAEMLKRIGDLYSKLLRQTDRTELEDRFVNQMNKISNEFAQAYEYVKNGLTQLDEIIKN